MGCVCSVLQDFCVNFCGQHGDYALKIKHGNRIGQAEFDYRRKVSINNLAIEHNTLRMQNINSQRRQSINSWYGNASSSSLGNVNELSLPPPKHGRRVSIASTEMNETILYELDEPPAIIITTSTEKMPEKGILKI